MRLSAGAHSPNPQPLRARYFKRQDSQETPQYSRVKKEPVLQRLRVAKTYAPGQDGAKRFARRHGSALVCVRHRLSDDGLTRYTTVELLVEVTPVATRQRSTIALRIPDSTKSMRSLLMTCGASWDAKHKVWLIPHIVAKGLRLLKYRAAIPG